MADEEKAILETVHRYLGCIRNYDPQLMHSLVLPQGTACLSRPHRQAEPLVMTLKESVDRIFNLESAEDEPDEQSFDETVHVEGGYTGIGCVWSQYRYLKKGKVQHTGSYMASLVKLDGRWIISGFADVARL